MPKLSHWSNQSRLAMNIRHLRDVFYVIGYIGKTNIIKIAIASKVA